MMECAHHCFGAKTICQNILSNYKKAAHMKLGWFFIFSKNFFSINWGWILSGRRQQGLKVKRNFRFWSHWRKTCRSCHKFSRLFEKEKTLKSTLKNILKKYVYTPRSHWRQGNLVEVVKSFQDSLKLHRPHIKLSLTLNQNSCGHF